MRAWRLFHDNGFSLVELMVVAAIVAILASVGIPAYINYVNRVKQSEAATYLLTARLELEESYADRLSYARTIGCLPSFSTPACLANCSACTRTTALQRWYTFSLNVTGTRYRIQAWRKIYPNAATDVLFVSSTQPTPIVQNTDALKFSVYRWAFQ